MYFDLAQVGMAGGADPADAERAEDAAVHLQRYRRQIVHSVVYVGLMKVCGGPGEDAADLGPSQHADVGERVNTFDLQFAHRLVSDAAVRAVRVGLDLALEPV